MSEDEKLTEMAQMILDKIGLTSKFTLEEIKESLRIRLDEIILKSS